MASKTSPPDLPDEAGPEIDMAEFGQRLARCRAALGEPVVLGNGGTRRTPSKRALLAEIDKAAAARGFKW